jgi:hypothetical protein
MGSAGRTGYYVTAIAVQLQATIDNSSTKASHRSAAQSVARNIHLQLTLEAEVKAEMTTGKELGTSEKKKRQGRHSLIALLPTKARHLLDSPTGNSSLLANPMKSRMALSQVNELPP